MNDYQIQTAWISALLLLAVIMMILFPVPAVIVTGMIGAPILVIVQVYIILRGQSPTSTSSTEDQWYEH